MTGPQEIREPVSESTPTPWIRFPEMGGWAHREDVRPRLERYDCLEQRFEAAWTSHLQAGSQSYAYLLHYGDPPVEYHVLVSVDDVRAHLPLPQQPADPNQPFITPYQALIDRIFTGNDSTFETYIESTGIQMEATEHE